MNVFAAGLCLLSQLLAPAEPRLFAVLAEYDRMARMPLWPGFEPGTIPLEILDGGRSWLVRHPDPPSEFAPVAGHPDVLVFDGRHASLRANTAVELSGVTTATAAFRAETQDPKVLAALALHEAFHAFQKRKHPAWGGNEVDLFLYPVEDEEALALRRLESTALGRALAATDPAVTVGWSGAAVAMRMQRFGRLPATSAAYERGTELKEGLARYIEAVAAPQAAPVLPEGEFGPAEVRDRAYASGCAMALLLDRMRPGWKQGLESREAALEELLAAAVGIVPPIEFAAADAKAAREKASRDVAAWRQSREALRREFSATPGWTVIVEAAAPLFPQGFDPLSFERLSSAEILHTRFVKLGNGAGALEVLDRRCLTEAAGKHPLFDGVRRATVAGLPEKPKVEESQGAVRITAQGLTLSFRGAHVTRTGQSISVKIDAETPAR